jgi:hypothetical protein
MKPKPWDSPYGQRKERRGGSWHGYAIDARPDVSVLVRRSESLEAIDFLKNNKMRFYNYGPHNKTGQFVINFHSQRDAVSFRLLYPNTSSIPDDNLNKD